MRGWEKAAAPAHLAGATSAADGRERGGERGACGAGALKRRAMWRKQRDSVGSVLLSSGPRVAAVGERLNVRAERRPLRKGEPGSRLEDGAACIQDKEGWHRGNLVELERLSRRLAALKREEPDVAPRSREPSRARQQSPARGALLAAKENNGDTALTGRGSHRGAQLCWRWDLLDLHREERRAERRPQWRRRVEGGRAAEEQ
mmetsp:Transcript_7462/g.23856  ORF Transcript_7462/g.23856 Transcript_7462/m.23856 type:complete len:203 (-) Transcript_7462:104-712(-)